MVVQRGKEKDGKKVLKYYEKKGGIEVLWEESEQPNPRLHPWPSLLGTLEAPTSLSKIMGSSTSLSTMLCDVHLSYSGPPFER